MKKHHPTQTNPFTWERAAPSQGAVGIRIFADKPLLNAIDETAHKQAENVASLPGVIDPVVLMPDVHTGYGFPIGAVAAFDPEQGGVVSAGGVGFDIGCGVRALVTNMWERDLEKQHAALADALFHAVPAGVGRAGDIHLSSTELDAMLDGGAVWAVNKGYGTPADIDRCEDRGRIKTANPDAVSSRAKERQVDGMGTLGSGNHYLEVQVVESVFDRAAAEFHGIEQGRIIIAIHSGSRGLGHQTATDYVESMLVQAESFGLATYAKELACAPLGSPLATSYFGAMAAAMNCALANRQILTHRVRTVLSDIFPGATARLLYDVSHNTCRVERHVLQGKGKRVYVHRKGATRALGPSHPDLPPFLRGFGQPVLIGGSMGTASYILQGLDGSADLSYCSASHGAGRVMSRKHAAKQQKGAALIKSLAAQGIEVRTSSLRGLSEEAPQAYKDIDCVANVMEHAGIAAKILRLKPLLCVKG
ncbi:RtcB family protein [Desulfovibrio inopinatus]|uniref:RtcB family protein n=1 Tax=Desulfovibrio inopinatus TaxID=102109 RepID=UPI00041FFBE0|nr:RtcB family protein [Desulfovibrio inopinatus]